MFCLHNQLRVAPSRFTEPYERWVVHNKIALILNTFGSTLKIRNYLTIPKVAASFTFEIGSSKESQLSGSSFFRVAVTFTLLKNANNPFQEIFCIRSITQNFF